MTDYIATTEAAALLKTALHTAFPGVRFSVREDRGTACAWLRASYTDGPTEKQAQTIADRYTGQQPNATTPVWYLVDGVIFSRQMGAHGRASTAAKIAPDVQALDPDGNFTTATLTPEQAVELAGANYAHGISTVKDIARQVFYSLDVTTT